MRIDGKCDFCGKEGNWEAGLFARQAAVKGRPDSWAAYFPANVPELPEGCTFRADELAKHGVEGATACPGCCREPEAVFLPPRLVKDAIEGVCGFAVEMG